MSKIPELALYPSQLKAMAPSFKIVYDKHIKPNLGQYPEIWAFGIVASGVIMEKVKIFQQEKMKSAQKVRNGTETNSQGYTPVPVNNNPVQTTQ